MTLLERHHPVIAIILLLLMAVAAAGGFYFVYQNFASSGEQSGSSQIQALGETSLSQLTIESVAAGKVYVRNVGASTIDGSKLTVYVDNVPVEVNVSTSSIAENGRATLKFTSVPSCAGSDCEIKVSGPSSASKKVGAEKLRCFSDSDCGYGESCNSGVCDLSADCGNGVCSQAEKLAQNCWDDCGLSPVFGIYSNSSTSSLEVVSMEWNGTNYEYTQNLTMSGWRKEMPYIAYDAGGNAVLSMSHGEDFDVAVSYYDGSVWSPFENLTSAPDDEHRSHLCSSDDTFLLVWHSEVFDVVQYIVGDGESWEEVGGDPVHNFT